MKLILRFYKLKVDYRAVTKKIRDDKDDKRGQYIKFTDKQRFEIGRYASQNGPAAPVRIFLKTFPSLNKNTVRSFRKRYEAHKYFANFIPQQPGTSNQVTVYNIKVPFLRILSYIL